MTPAEAPTNDSLQAARYIVRHGSMRQLGDYEAAPGATYQRGQQVIIRSPRGQEIADLLCPSTPLAVAQVVEPTTGAILRLATEADCARARQIRQDLLHKFDLARGHVRTLSLPMQLVDLEQLFGGERLVFYFLADKRVDFRELVKLLAREFQTRIELRQIGVRDEAKLLADFGDCGKPVCCNTHMAVMPPVSMKMAKLQKSTLDPSKISGRCGRLKCCLRFEQDVYEEFQAQMPAINSRVVTRKGQGKVLAHEILAKKLLIEFEDGRRLPVNLDEVLTRL